MTPKNIYRNSPDKTAAYRNIVVINQNRKESKFLPVFFQFRCPAKSDKSDFHPLPFILHHRGDCDGAGNGGADHRVVPHAHEAHHFHVGRDGRGTGELGVGVHAAHGIGHTIGSRTGSHVIRVQGASGTAAGSNGEVLLAHFVAFLLVGAGDRVLEAGRVGGVAGDGNIRAFVVHDGDAFADVIGAEAADLRAVAVGIGDFADDFKLAGEVVELGLDIGEAVDTGNDHGGVFP